MIEANNPQWETWIHVPDKSDFPIQNIPFGIGEFGPDIHHACTRIGDTIIDLYALAENGLLLNSGVQNPELLKKEALNELLKLGKSGVRLLRNHLSRLFRKDNPLLRDNEELREKCLFPYKSVSMKLPVKVENYTDFYSSIEHATNVGTMFRGKEKALMPNWRYLPVGYHGRSSSIVVSGEAVRRPWGQQLPDPEAPPVFGPSRLVDFELEMAFVTCGENQQGSPIPITETEDYIIGFVLFNDWSARDIQAWEYVPLGPFLSKNWASSVSPWIVTLDALEAFRVKGPHQDPEVFDYLRSEGKRNFDIELEVLIQPEGGEENLVCRSNFKYMYWNICQQLAHHTINGCNIKVGDMYASGTISGPTPDSFGSMLELTWRGANPLKLNDGSERKFINDFDTVIMRGYAEKGNLRIGFGEVSSQLLPAIKDLK